MKNKFDIKDFKPVDGNVVVQPAPVKKIRTLIPEPVEYSPVKKGSANDEVKKIIKTYEKQPTNIRVGQLIAIPESLATNEHFELTEGDWVIYFEGGRQKTKLDLLASKSDDDSCPVIMKSYEILSKVNID